MAAARKGAGHDYNPNVMAPAEQRLLHTLLLTEGDTQPAVVSPARATAWWTAITGCSRVNTSRVCVAWLSWAGKMCE